MCEVIEINDAIKLLKEGIILKDNLNSKFIYKKERIYVYSSSSYYSLKTEEFIELFKENKFVVEDFDDSTIDAEKDREYYGFKHK